MRLSFAQCGEDDVAPEDVVSILASLIDQVGPPSSSPPLKRREADGGIQSYIRGQLSYSQQYLVMRKVPGDPFAGFPAVASVRPRQVQSVG
jgi:hypothetical protein